MLIFDSVIKKSDSRLTLWFWLSYLIFLCYILIMGKAEIKYCKSFIYMHSSNKTKWNFHVIVFENVHLSKINTSKCTINVINQNHHKKNNKER